MDTAETDVRLVEPGQSICQRVHKRNISDVGDLRVRVVRFDCSFAFGNCLRNLRESPSETRRRFVQQDIRFRARRATVGRVQTRKTNQKFIICDV